MSEGLVEVDYSDPLAILFINRPDVLNAYNEKLLDNIKNEIEKIVNNDKIKALIITGKGNRAFSVGADLEWLEHMNSEKAKKISEKGQKICDMIEQSSIPVIAAINGYALGGGMEIALACDLRIASTRARFGQPEVSLGIIPGFDGTQRLPKIIGLGQAKELLFTGNIIDAEEAAEINLVNKLVTPRDLLKESKELAQEISEKSSQAIKYIKKVINSGNNKEESSKLETEAFGCCFDNEEHLERIKQRKEIIKS